MALLVSASAAYYSVFGLSHLFSGAGIAIVIMASSLEAAKLVVATLLHRYWKKLHWLIKSYLTTALLTLMLITSAGIYGFLTNAYQATSQKSQLVDSQVLIQEGKKLMFEENIQRIEVQINSKENRITTLTNLRTQQETRLDSLYQRRSFRSARKTEAIIKEANEDIKVLEADVDTLNTEINVLNDSIGQINIRMLDMQMSNEAAAELGPLKYLAGLLDKPMDVVINWLMLMLVFVFDPLAIVLVITASRAFDIARGKMEQLKPKKSRRWRIYGEKKKNEIEMSTPEGKEFNVPYPIKEEVPKKDHTKEINNLQKEIEKINNSGLMEKRRNEEAQKLQSRINKLKSEDDENQITY
jgi:hypothetical protein